MNEKLEVVKVESNFQLGNYREFEPFIQTLVKNPKNGIATERDAMLVILKAKELGLGLANVIDNLYVFSGKVTVDYKVIKALLQKPGTGVTFKLIEDMTPLYNYIYIKIGKDGAKTPILVTQETVEQNKDMYFIVPYLNNNPIVSNKLEEGVICVVKEPNGNPYNYRTTYHFKRKKLDIDGTMLEEEHIESYTWNEALKSGKPYDKKMELNDDSAWQAYRKIMMRAKTLKFGANEIASDIIMGSRTPDEYLDQSKTNYRIEEEGTITLLDKQGNPINKEQVNESSDSQIK